MNYLYIHVHKYIHTYTHARTHPLEVKTRNMTFGAQQKERSGHSGVKDIKVYQWFSMKHIDLYVFKLDFLLRYDDQHS